MEIGANSIRFAFSAQIVSFSYFTSIFPLGCVFFLFFWQSQPLTYYTQTHLQNNFASTVREHFLSLIHANAMLQSYTKNDTKEFSWTFFSVHQSQCNIWTNTNNTQNNTFNNYYNFIFHGAWPSSIHHTLSLSCEIYRWQPESNFLIWKSIPIETIITIEIGFHCDCETCVLHSKHFRHFLWIYALHIQREEKKTQ